MRGGAGARATISAMNQALTRSGPLAALALVLLAGAPALAQPKDAAPGASPLDWRTLEAPCLSGHTQLTFPERFARAGEAYFSPDGAWIIFQAIPAPAQDQAPQAHYDMFVARLRYPEGSSAADRPAPVPVGIDEPIRLSTPGSANTCGFFHPLERGRVIFASTRVPPAASAPAGYQRGTSTYSWQFPAEMEILTQIVLPILYDGRPKLTEDVDIPAGAADPAPLLERPGYTAECAYSPDGRHVVFTNVDPETLDPDLFVLDTADGEVRPLVRAPGYDGGPFFSPDGRAICYRSDRAGNDLLQVMVAELEIDAGGAVRAVRTERAVTSDEHVNWAPFWHPSGAFLLFTTSRNGHRNYEIYSVEALLGDRAAKRAAELRSTRITSADGFDGLPAFNHDASLMMWTSQRAPKRPQDERASSQLWIARAVDLRPR